MKKNRHSAPTLNHLKIMLFKCLSISTECHQGRSRSILTLHTVAHFTAASSWTKLMYPGHQAQYETRGHRRGCCQTISNAKPQALAWQLWFTAWKQQQKDGCHNTKLLRNLSKQFVITVLMCISHMQTNCAANVKCPEQRIHSMVCANYAHLFSWENVGFVHQFQILKIIGGTAIKLRELETCIYHTSSNLFKTFFASCTILSQVNTYWHFHQH